MRSLFIGKGGYLTCSSLQCPQPAVGREIERLRSALATAQEQLTQILVNDEVISADRMREILGMKPEEQRAHWRFSHQVAACPPVHVEVRRESEGLSRVLVHIEINGKWRTILNSLHVDGCHTSEIVEPLGILKALEAPDGECLECGAPSDDCKRNRETHGVHLRRPNYAE